MGDQVVVPRRNCIAAQFIEPTESQCGKVKDFS